MTLEKRCQQTCIDLSKYLRIIVNKGIKMHSIHGLGNCPEKPDGCKMKRYMKRKPMQNKHDSGTKSMHEDSKPMQT
jgi:hypothetical protein